MQPAPCLRAVFFIAAARWLPVDTQAAYLRHRESARRDAARARPFSAGRPDWLLLRVEGHSREAVADAVFRHAQEGRAGEKRNWRHYAERTAAYAFGVAGDAELVKSGMLTPPQPVENPPASPKRPEDEARREMPRLRMR